MKAPTISTAPMRVDHVDAYGADHSAEGEAQVGVRRVGKGASAPCPPFFESNVFTASGGHAAERVRARPLCPPYALKVVIIALIS